jgi:hypothetical protein
MTSLYFQEENEVEVRVEGEFSKLSGEGSKKLVDPGLLN